MRVYWLAIGAICLTGCVSYQPQPVSPVETAAHFSARRLNDPGLKAFLEKYRPETVKDWPRVQWNFDNLTLAAFYFHPSLEVARAQWRVAEAGVMTAGGRPNPTISVTPGYDFTASGGLSPWIPGANFDLPIETAGKRDHRIDQAKQLSESVRLNIIGVAWQVRSNLRSALLDLTSAQKRQSLLQQQLSIQEQLLRSWEQRLAAGAAARSEIIPVRLGIHKTQIDLSDARHAETEALGRVAEAIGLPPSALDNVTLSCEFPASLASLDLLSTQEARARALQNRADVRSALAEYAASQSALQLEIAKQYPDVHLGTGYQWDQGDSKWQLGLTAEIPVLNRNQGPIAEAEARRNETRVRFAALQAKIITDAERAVSGVKLAHQQMAGVETLLAGEQHQLAAVRAQREAGAAELNDLLAAQLEAASAELVRLDQWIKGQQAIAALEDALQQPVGSLASPAIESVLPPSESPHDPSGKTVAGQRKEKHP